MEALGSLSLAGWEGGSGKMSRVGGRVGLGTITKDHFVCRFGNVSRPCAKEGLVTISRAGWEGRSGNMARLDGREGIGIISRDYFV
jgi:hypothetical protein